MPLKVREIREWSDADLAARIAEKAEELANLRFQLELHQLDNTAKVRNCRRELARLLTVRRERQLGVGKAPVPAATPTTGGPR